MPIPSLEWFRRIALSLGVAVGSYGLVAMAHRTDLYHSRLLEEVVGSPSPGRERAANALANLGGEARLFQTLYHTNKEVREAARRALDAHWFSEKGASAAREMLEAERAANNEAYDEALARLNAVLKTHPDFSDAYNRRASLLWKMDRVGASKKDCERALHLNPQHYGAWLGLGLCHVELGNHDEAILCLQMYLRLQPYDIQARHWLHQCSEIQRLSSLR